SHTGPSLGLDGRGRIAGTSCSRCKLRLTGDDAVLELDLNARLGRTGRWSDGEEQMAAGFGHRARIRVPYVHPNDRDHVVPVGRRDVGSTVSGTPALVVI